MSSKKRDYYEVLGLSKNSDEKEIKTAYRKLSMKLHPDRNKAPDAEEKFKEVQEAYEILSNPESRSKYDKFGHAAFDPNSHQGGGFGGFDGVDLGDIFSQFFGGGFGRASNRPMKGQDGQAQISISFIESYQGKKITEKLEKWDGEKRTRIETEIEMPAGIADGQQVILRGYGGRGRNGGPSGDLYLVVRVLPHRFFIRDGKNINIQIPVSAFDILIEKEIDIPTPSGLQKIKLKKSYDSQSKIVISRKGFPGLGGTHTGDLVVFLKIYMPEIDKKNIPVIEKMNKNSKKNEYEKFMKDFE